MTVGVINALPMSIIQQRTTLNPNVANEELKQLLNDAEVLWLWGHKNTSKLATDYLNSSFGLSEYLEAFGERPSIYVKDRAFYAKTLLGEEVMIDHLLVLAPTFTTSDRKAEGQVATSTDVIGFRPILVEI